MFDVIPQTRHEETRDVVSMLAKCWGNVADGGPTLSQNKASTVTAEMARYNTCSVES